MKIQFFIGKYRYSAIKQKFSKQSIVNFVGAHPRLITLMAGLGISFAFAYVGRVAVHEAFAASSTSSASVSPIVQVDSATTPTIDHITKFQVDYIDKTPISTVPGHVTNVAVGSLCTACVKEFAPGQEAISPG